MKIRLGFVSNSSTSSYICTCCNYVEAGYDMCREEAEFKMCENGHDLCYSCAPANADVISYVDNMSGKDLLHFLEKADNTYSDYNVDKIIAFCENLDNKKLKEKVKDLSIPAAEQQELESFLSTRIPEELCCICTLKSLDDYTAGRYLLVRNHMTYKDLINDVQESFKNHQKLNQFINDENAKLAKEKESSKT